MDAFLELPFQNRLCSQLLDLGIPVGWRNLQMESPLTVNQMKL